MKYRIPSIYALLTAAINLAIAPAIALTIAQPLQAQQTHSIDASRNVMMPEIGSIATLAEEGGAITLTVMPADLRPEENRALDLKMGDQVLMMNGKRIRSIEALRELYEGIPEGEDVKIALERGEDRLMVSFAKGDGRGEMVSSGDHGGGMRVIIAGHGSGNVQLLHEARAILGEEDGKVRVTNQFQDIGNLREGDAIEKLNGQAIGSLDDFRKIYEDASIGDRLIFSVHRGTEVVEVVVEKEEMPEGMMIRSSH